MVTTPEWPVTMTTCSTAFQDGFKTMSPRYATKPVPTGRCRTINAGLSWLLRAGQAPANSRRGRTLRPCERIVTRCR